MNILYNKTKYIVVMLFLLFACILGIGLSGRVVFAQSTVSTNLFMPQSKMQSLALNSPMETCALDNGIATIQENNVVLYFSNGNTQTISGFSSLKQLKLMNSQYLLVSSNGTVYKISLTTYTSQPLEYEQSGTKTVGGNYFDFNGKYLITAYGTTLNIFEVNGTTVSILGLTVENVNGDYPIAINENGDIFYHTGTIDVKLCKRNLNDFSTVKEIKSLQPSKLIANNSYAYYIVPTGITRLSLLDYSETVLNLESNNFDLGNKDTLTSPKGICFNGENILITDSTLNAIQEFRIEKDSLVFTGKAIASGKTAFNRIKNDASDIENCGKALAVLDSNKLTIIKDTTLDLYNNNNYINIFLNAGIIEGFSPNLFALGNNSVILGQTNTVKIIEYYQTEKVVFTKTFEGGNNIIDLSYQNGNYYVTKIKDGTGSSLVVYKIYLDDNGEYACSDTPILTTDNSQTFDSTSKVAVDVSENVYITSALSNSIFKYTKGTPYTFSEMENSFSSGVLKISCDFASTLFVCTQDSISYLYNDECYDIPMTFIDDKLAKSFALNYDEKSVYFIFDNSELIENTITLPNITIENIKVPTQFVITSNTADINKLKIYTSKNGFNVYKVSVDNDKFIYDGLFLESEKTYVLVCGLDISCKDEINDITRTINYVALTTKTNINATIFTLIDANGINDITSVTPQEKKVFIATGVNMYYIPIITENNMFCLTENKEVIRLNKKTEVNVLNSVNVMEENFLFISVTDGEKTICGYIPENYTVSVLSENIVGVEHNDTILSKNQNTFRNSLIVIALCLSVFATSLFFILRKKDK